MINTSVDFSRQNNLKVFSSINEDELKAHKTRNRLML